MRVAVLAAADSWYLNDLRRAAGSRHELVGVGFDRMAACLDHRGRHVQAGEHRLTDFDAVIVRTMPPGSLEQVVFRMDALGILAEAGVVVINPPRAIEAAVDKYLASAKLHAAGLRVVGNFPIAVSHHVHRPKLGVYTVVSAAGFVVEHPEDILTPA